MVESAQDKAKKEIAEEVIRDFQRLSARRGNWESHWQEIAQRMLPMHSNSFTSFGKNDTQGEKRNQYLYDSTAMNALNRFVAIADSLLTPSNQIWHRVVPSDPILAKNRQVQLYFEEVNRLLWKYRYAPRTNYQSQNQGVYQSLGAYGTGCLYIDKLDGQPGIRYRCIHLSEIYFRQNHQGIIDFAHRRFPMSARQAFQTFGEKLPATIKSALKDRPDEEFFFHHCVKPRKDVDASKIDYRGMPFASYYIAEEGKTFLSEGGYRTFPYPISRYVVAPGEEYGRSPAMDVLPANKTLNEMKKTVLTAGHRATDPIYLLHDDGVLDAFSAVPGSMVAGGVSKDGRPLVHTLQPGRVDITKDLMDDERNDIKDAFLVTLFQILTENPTMSATEVLERTREKGILLAPTFGRQNSEYLGPKIEREISLLEEQRLLPPPPPILLEARGEYTVQYDSPITRTMSAEGGAGLMRTLDAALRVAEVTQNPEPLDHFEWDTIIPDLAENNAVPFKWMRDPRKVQEIRAGRSEQMEAETAIQAAPAAAAMVKAGVAASKGK